MEHLYERCKLEINKMLEVTFDEKQNDKISKKMLDLIDINEKKKKIYDEGIKDCVSFILDIESTINKLFDIPEDKIENKDDFIHMSYYLYNLRLKSNIRIRRLINELNICKKFVLFLKKKLKEYEKKIKIIQENYSSSS